MLPPTGQDSFYRENGGNPARSPPEGRLNNSLPEVSPKKEPRKPRLFETFNEPGKEDIMAEPQTKRADDDVPDPTRRDSGGGDHGRDTPEPSLDKTTNPDPIIRDPEGPNR